MTLQKIKDEDGWYKRIGKIGHISLGVEDHGLLVLNIDFDFGGSGQGYQVVLDNYFEKEERRRGTVFGCELIRRICLMFGAENIFDITGTTAFALYDSDEYGSYIRGIENPAFNKGAYSGASSKLITKELVEEFKE